MRLVATDLSAQRGEDPIFSGVSFALSAGEALVVTGPNGVGKSTLLRALAGLLAPASGNLTFEERGRTGRLAERAHYLGHQNAMKRELTVRENLSFWKSFMASEHGGPALPVLEAADAVGLGSITHLPFGYLSAGQQRRMAMAKLLVVHRPVWLLDEPTAALDTASEAMFARLVSEHCAAGGITIAATHRPLGLDNPQRLEMSAYRSTARLEE